MKLVAKFGILLLSLVTAGVPVMACMLPSSVLTVQEKACCRQMASECGGQQMPPSHSCCKTVTPDQSALAQSSYKLLHHVQLLWLAQLAGQVAALPRRASADFAVLVHSPPQAPACSADILRI